MQLFKSIIYNILKIQEKFLKYQLAKTIGAKNTSKKKRHYFNGCTVDLSTLAENEKQKLEDEIILILKKCSCSPEEILEYVNTQGTKVVYLDNASKILNPIGENEGFIYPARGSKALYLGAGVLQKFTLKTPEMFVLSKGKINKYYFIYHFYNWFAFKNNISGLDTEAQELLKKYLYDSSDTKSLQLADIYKLKDAIKQDKAAIEFVIKLCRSYEGTKQALEKMKTSGSASL